MSKYIEAEAIKMGKHPIIVNDFTKGWNYAIDAIVENAPAADVQEIKRGRWIIDREFGNDVMSDEQMVICSECGKGIFWGKQNYCPNCGSRMDLEGEEE